MKKFFSITENHYQFDIMDLITLLTILNVGFILLGYWFAPIFGIIACVISLGVSIKNNGYINNYVMQLALLVLNFYFLLK